MKCLYFCFSDVLKKDLEDICIRWNAHRVRRNNNSSLPSGVPNFLYSFPECLNYEERGRTYDPDVWEHLNSINSQSNIADYSSDDFAEWALQEMMENEWSLPTDKDSAFDLYGKLLIKLRA